MTGPDTTARNRFLMIAASRVMGVAGAMLGLVIIARATALEHRILGTALVVSALIVIAVVPAALARRWRTPPS